MNEKQITYPIEDRWSYLWLAIGIVLSFFSVPIGNYGIILGRRARAVEAAVPEEKDLAPAN
jgi:hypothetical protein